MAVFGFAFKGMKAILGIVKLIAHANLVGTPLDEKPSLFSWELLSEKKPFHSTGISSGSEVPTSNLEISYGLHITFTSRRPRLFCLANC